MKTNTIKKKTIFYILIEICLIMISMTIVFKAAGYSTISASAEEYEQIIGYEENDRETTKSFSEHEVSENIMTLSSGSGRSSKEGIISGTDRNTLLSSDLTGVKYIPNANYFLLNPQQGINDGSDNKGGTCTTVAMQMLMGYHNYYSDRRIIPKVAAIATVALLVAATVIIYNWEPLKAGFNQLINFFVESAGALGNTIRDVFGRMGADAEATRKKEDAARKSRVDAIVRELTREKKGLVIYRYGNKTNLNLTPRPVDALTGLSFLTIPNYMSNMAISTIPLVNGTGALKAIQDGLQHVSVKPSNDHDGSLLNQWITSRGSSTPHRFTSLLSAVCIEYRVNG